MGACAGAGGARPKGDVLFIRNKTTEQNNFFRWPVRSNLSQDQRRGAYSLVVRAV